jgi:protein-tyrosine-phosphatase
MSAAAGAAARPRSVLFICERNATRSRLAESIAHTLFGATVRIASAGVHPGEADPFTAAVLVEAGYPAPDETARGVERAEDLAFDLVVTLSPVAHHRALELARAGTAVEYWPTFDPTVVEGNREQRLLAYRGVRDALRARIMERLG